MNAVHLVSTGLAGAALAVASVGGHHVERRGGPHARLLALIVGGALLLGNIVSLLPDAPAWYSLTMTALTAMSALGAVAWLSQPVAQTPAARPAAARQTDRPRSDAGRPARRTTTPLYAVPDAEPVDAEIVADAVTSVTGTGHASIADLIAADATRATPQTDAHDTPALASILRHRPRTVVTADDLHDLSPAGSRTTVGTGRYVAADIGDYAPRIGRADVAARRHGVTVTDDDTARRLRVLRAYGASGDLRGRLQNGHS